MVLLVGANGTNANMIKIEQDWVWLVEMNIWHAILRHDIAEDIVPNTKE